MFPSVLLSNSASLSEEATVFSSTRVQDFGSLNPMVSSAINDNSPHQQPQKIKKKRNLPGNPDPDAEVIALSPTTLLATNRFLCEICNKGFQRDQNLQLHRRGHNLPWKLKQRNNKDVIRKRAYVCPEPTCVHHHPSRALGDLTGIKKHFCRKHGEKKWKCEKCSKIYAVQSDWKAHSKTCGTREYRCDCGTLFSRKDSFVTHRAFCDALAEESARVLHSSSANHLEILTTAPPPPTPSPHPISATHQLPPFHLHPQNPPPPPPPVIPFSAQNHHTHFLNPWDPTPNPNPNNLHHQNPLHMIKHESVHLPPPLSSSPFFQPPPPHNATSPHLSATALLQKAANIGAHPVGHVASTMMTGLDKFTGSGDLTAPEYMGFAAGNIAKWQKSDRLTRDFLGLTRECGGGGSSSGGGGSRNMLSFTGGVEYPTAYERESCSLVKAQGYGFAEPPSPPPETWG